MLYSRFLPTQVIDGDEDATLVLEDPSGCTFIEVGSEDGVGGWLKPLPGCRPLNYAVDQLQGPDGDKWIAVEEIPLGADFVGDAGDGDAGDGEAGAAAAMR